MARVLGYVLLLAVLMLAATEALGRWLGLGDPVLYYNAAWGGLRPLPEQRVQRLRGATVTIDANGFRSARPPVPGAIHVLYLGDSVVWGGSAVDDTALLSEVAADVLRARGLDVYAMNAGVNGASLINQAEIFLHADQRVDVLVWLFPWGDVMRGYASAGYLWPARYKPRFAVVEMADHWIRAYWLRAFRELPAPSRPWEPPLGPPGYEDFFAREVQRRHERNLAALRAALDEARSRGLPVILGVTPSVDGGRLAPMPGEASRLLAELEASGIRILDVQGAMEAAGAGAGVLFVDPVHFSAEGHRVVGATLGSLLAEVLPRTPSAVAGAEGRAR